MGRMQSLAYSVLCVLASAAGAQSCTEKQLNKAQMGFRDCMEERKGGMLALDPEEEPDIHQAICQGLEVRGSRGFKLLLILLFFFFFF